MGIGMGCGATAVVAPAVSLAVSSFIETVHDVLETAAKAKSINAETFIRMPDC